MSTFSLFQKKNPAISNETSQPKQGRAGVKTASHSVIVNQLRSPSKAQKWVEQLPLTDMGETTRQLFVALVGLNKEPLAPNVRIDVTEIIAPFVRMSLENLDKHFQSRSFPLPERSQKLYDLKLAILMELAGSYQLASLDMLTKGSVNKKKLLLSINRAIKYMSRVLLNGYDIYARSPKNVWHDIHHLYLMAYENKVHQSTIGGKDETGETELTTEQYYKLINLVALSGPNSLRQGEIAKVTQFFRAYLENISLVEDASGVTSKYAHIALLNSDEPAALMPVSDMVNSPTSRLFDLSRAIHALDDFVSKSEETELGLDPSLPMLTHSLAKRLVYSLTTIRNRRFKRFPRDENCSLVIRMHDVLQILHGGQSESFIDEINEDIEDDNIYTELNAAQDIESPWSEIDLDALGEDLDVVIHSWHIDNSSTGGYGLSQINRESSSARVGELVAIKDPRDNQAQWQISVIRWMDFIKGKGLCMGLEILSPSGMPVVAEQVANREVTQTFPIEGIYLPKIEGARDEPNLIFPGYILRVDDEVILNLSSRQEKIKITSVIDTLGSFSYCGFEPLTETADGKDNLDEFDDVWEFI